MNSGICLRKCLRTVVVKLGKYQVIVTCLKLLTLCLVAGSIPTIKIMIHSFPKCHSSLTIVMFLQGIAHHRHVGRWSGDTDGSRGKCLGHQGPRVQEGWHEESPSGGEFFLCYLSQVQRKISSGVLASAAEKFGCKAFHIIFYQETFKFLFK